jgi:hypothetical protein
VRLLDGGVFDNQGVATPHEQECQVMLISDASQTGIETDPNGDRLAVAVDRSQPRRTLRFLQIAESPDSRVLGWPPLKRERQPRRLTGKVASMKPRVRLAPEAKTLTLRGRFAQARLEEKGLSGHIDDFSGMSL